MIDQQPLIQQQATAILRPPSLADAGQGVRFPGLRSFGGPRRWHSVPTGSWLGPLTPVSASLLFISFCSLVPTSSTLAITCRNRRARLRLRRMHEFLNDHVLNASAAEFGNKAEAHAQLDGYAQAPRKPGWPIVRCRNRTSSVSYVGLRIRWYHYLHGSL